MDDLFDHQTVPEYNTRAVEKRTGIPADTFRAWERRHGLPAPARTPGNHRLYSERDIAIIVWLKQMTDRGVSISHAVSMARRKLDEVAAQPASPSGSQGHDADLRLIQERLIAAFIRFDARQANQHIEEALAMYGVEVVCLDIIQPALFRLGHMWERGEICVAVEHFGTSFCMRKLSALFNASEPEFGDPTIIASCVEGEMHEIGLLITSLLLSRAGFRVIYLGANLPGCELHEAVKTIQPDAVVLSAPSETATQTLRSTIATLRASSAPGTGPTIGYGGAIFEQKPELRDTIDACYLGKDARSARGALQQELQPQPERLMMTTP